jgi:hypothetical protein
MSWTRYGRLGSSAKRVLQLRMSSLSFSKPRSQPPNRPFVPPTLRVLLHIAENGHFLPFCIWNVLPIGWKSAGFTTVSVVLPLLVCCGLLDVTTGQPYLLFSLRTPLKIHLTDPLPPRRTPTLVYENIGRRSRHLAIQSWHWSLRDWSLVSLAKVKILNWRADFSHNVGPHLASPTTCLICMQNFRSWDHAQSTGRKRPMTLAGFIDPERVCTRRCCGPVTSTVFYVQNFLRLFKQTAGKLPWEFLDVGYLADTRTSGGRRVLILTWTLTESRDRLVRMLAASIASAG